MRIVRKILNRRVGITLLTVLLVALVAATVNVIGIQLAGDVPEWDRWLKNKTPLFLAWRLLLYAATLYGWIWMRKRVLQREDTPEGSKRIKRVEISSVASIVLLEVTYFLSQG